MAPETIYTSENCPGMPKGAVVRMHTDRLAADQQAAWLHARRVHSQIYWQNRLKQEATPMMNTSKQGARELKRRALRWQKHRIPRRQPMPFGQRLCAWLMVVLMAGLFAVCVIWR